MNRVSWNSPVLRQIAIALLVTIGIAGIAITRVRANYGTGSPIYYGERTCRTYDPVPCPFGMKLSAGNDDQFYCVNPISNFCRILTGSTRNDFVAPAQSGDFQYCSLKPLAQYGSCSGVPTGSGSNLSKFTFTPQGEAVAKSLLENLATLGISKDSITCDQPTANGQDHLVIPTVSGIDDLNNLSKMRTASSTGVAVARGFSGSYTSGANFCFNENDIYMNVTIYRPNRIGGGTYPDNIVKPICVTGVGQLNQMTPCKIPAPIYPNLIAKTGASPTNNNTCLRGYDQPAANGHYYYTETGTIVKTDIKSAGGVSKLNLVDANSSYCKQVALEVMQARSNTGCSTFAKYDNQTNTFVATAEWEKCASCIYGADAKVTRETLLNNQYVDKCELYPGIVGGCPADGTKLTVNNEPFVDAIPGALFTEAGCIGTSDLSTVVNTILRIALGIMGGIVILRIIQGAITMQQGSPESYEEGRAIITSALIGLLVLIFSAAILNFLGVNILNLRNFPRFG